MAMIPCPGCNNPVSDQAPSCPSCGRQFAAMGYMPPGYHPSGLAPRKGTSGATIAIIVVVIVIGVFGMMAVPAVFGVRKYIANAKTAEARNTLGQLSKDAIAAYDERHKLCPSATQPVPAKASEIRGKKYMSSSTEWMKDGPDAGFGCLKFELSMPQYYQYEYQATATTFVVRAHGDLDGDGVLSTFEMHGQVVGDHLEVDSSITDSHPEE